MAINDRAIGEDFVQNAIITWLSKHDWKIIKIATLSGRGVDIKACHNKYSRYYLIEAKGAKDSSSEEVAFVYSLGDIITVLACRKGLRIKQLDGFRTKLRRSYSCMYFLSIKQGMLFDICQKIWKRYKKVRHQIIIKFQNLVPYFHTVRGLKYLLVDVSADYIFSFNTSRAT